MFHPILSCIKTILLNFTQICCDRADLKVGHCKNLNMRALKVVPNSLSSADQSTIFMPRINENHDVMIRIVRTAV